MVKKYKAYEYFIYFSTLIMLGMLQILPVQIVGGYTFRFIVGLFGIILFGLCIISKGKNHNFYLFTCRVRIIFIIYLLCLIISIIYTKFLYNYSLYDISIAIMPYLFIFYMYPIAYCLLTDKYPRHFLKTIARFTTVFLIIRLMTWLSYNQFNIQLFPQLLYEYGESWIRNGSLRINSGYLIGVALSYYLACFFYSKKKLKFGIIIALYIIFISIVTASRYQLIVILITILISYIYSKSSELSRAKKIIFIVLLISILIFSPIVSDFIESFSINNTVTGGSTTIRLLTIEHFWNYIVQNRSWAGVGLLIQENTNALTILRKSQWRLFYLEDIGILGGIFKFGILSIGIYYGLYFYSIKSYKIAKRSDGWQRVFLMGMIVYFWLSNLALNVFDLQRAFDVPFYMAIFISSTICIGNVKRDYIGEN